MNMPVVAKNTSNTQVSVDSALTTGLKVPRLKSRSVSALGCGLWARLLRASTCLTQDVQEVGKFMSTRLECFPIGG